MPGTAVLRYVVVASACLSCAALALLVVRTYRTGRRPIYARPLGAPRAGVAYAFGRGMLPWEKESAARHLPTYIGGSVYHLGVFAALFTLAATWWGWLPGPRLLVVLRVLLALGLVSGLGLLAKRILLPPMRFISRADDYAANLLVDALLAAALGATWTTAAHGALFVVAIATFLYIPLGKIRHCAFFFYARLVFGAYFGRRRVLPHAAASSDS